jgi:hypothetical protein
MAEFAGSNPTEPIVLFTIAATIRADDGDNEDEKSHNSDAAEDSEERTDDDVTTPPLRDIWKRGSVSMNCTQIVQVKPSVSFRRRTAMGQSPFSKQTKY